MQRSIVVEYVGLAGVGKTTLCNKLFDKIIQDSNTSCYKINKPIPIKNKISLKVFLQSLLITIKSNPKISKKLFINLKDLYVSQMRIKYSRLKGGIHLSDQGVFQVLGTLRKYSKSQERIDFSEHRLTDLILPDLLLILKSDAKTIARQRYERDKVYEYEDIERGQMRQNHLIEDVKYLSTVKGGFNYLILYINENTDYDSMLLNIIAKICSMIKNLEEENHV